MTEMVKTNICEGVNFGSVMDDRFKIGRLSVSLYVPLRHETAAANALLSQLLTRSCRQFPDFTSMNRHLDDLYGANLYSFDTVNGPVQKINLTAVGLDDRYCFQGDTVSDKLAHLLCTVLFEPHMPDGLFPQEDFEQEQRQLLEDIDAEFSDKRYYGTKRCIEIMCQNEPIAIGSHGSRKEVAALTREDLSRAWDTLLKTARVEIMMLGGADPELAFSRFCTHFASSPRKVTLPRGTAVQPGEVRRVVETDELAQSKLFLGFRGAVAYDARDRLANTLMALILGGLPTSKLFLNVREKNSLCYYCAASMDNPNGILMVDSGVETENIERAEEAIMEQVDLLKKGLISHDELEQARLAYRNALLSACDSLSTLESFYQSNVVYDSALSPSGMAELLESITKEEIVEKASHIALDTVYALVGR